MTLELLILKGFEVHWKLKKSNQFLRKNVNSLNFLSVKSVPCCINIYKNLSSNSLNQSDKEFKRFEE